MFISHFQLQLKSSLKLTLTDIDMAGNGSQLFMFLLLIPSTFSHAFEKTGRFLSVAEKYWFILICITELKFLLCEYGEGQP